MKMQKIDYFLFKKNGMRQGTFLLFFLALLSLNPIHAQRSSSNKASLDAMKTAYSNIKHPEITFTRFVEINSHIYQNGTANPATLAVQDPYCNNLRSYCTNGNFETGLDQAQWTGAYGLDYSGITPDPFSLTYGYSSGPINVSSSHQTIVSSTDGNDPNVPIPQVAVNGGTKALRLGNSVTGNGTEVLAKTIVVDVNETILSFYYALVFQDPGHSYNDQPAFSVRVYDCATGSEITGVCDLGNGSNVAVSNASNPFFQSAGGGSIAYKNWSSAQINLAAHVGKKVTIIFETKDCNLGGHFGYAYLDNIFSNLCPIGGEVIAGQPDIRLDTPNTSTCAVGKICAKYSLPYTNTSTTGTVNISLNIYQAGALVTTLTSGVLSTGTNYCFNINPAALGLNNGLGGFDYSLTGNFILSGFSLSPLTAGNPPNGFTAGVNNDYLITCPVLDVYYSKPSGNLHDLDTWGTNADGTGTAPSDFGAGKTFNLANRAGVYTLTNDWTVAGTIVNPTGSVLQINGFTLSEAGLSGTGMLAGSPTSNLFITGNAGGDAGTINFVPGTGSLFMFTINRTGALASATIGTTPVNVFALLSVTNGTLNTNNILTLKSTVANTARVAPIGGAVSGNVTVERYIPARRAWRILSAPVGGIQTINQSIQEGAANTAANPVPNYGTFITGGSASDGFDQSGGATSSMKYYSSVANNWVGITNTNSTTVGGIAYMTFVYGNRNSNTIPVGSTPGNTTLRATGPMKIGNQVYAVNPMGFTAIPNPYPSPINFATITRSGVANTFYVWDPKIGGVNGVGAYVTVSYNGSYYDVSANAISLESQFIQSGQGFLVYPAVSGTGGSITIKESDKTNTPAADVFRTVGGVNSNNETVANAPIFADPTKGQGLRLSLHAVNNDGTTSVLDEIFSSYKADYANKVDALDAVKATNMGENLAIVREGQTFAIERKTLPIDGDVIQLKLWNTKVSSYMLEFNPVNISLTGLTAYIKDSYLNTSTPISLTELSHIYFSINSNAASARTDRFSLVFSKNKVAEVFAKNSITAYPNPFEGRNLNLQFTDQPAGSYVVTISSSAGNVLMEKTVQHIGGSSIHALPLDKKLPTGLYKVQIASKSATINLQILSK